MNSFVVFAGGCALRQLQEVMSVRLTAREEAMRGPSPTCTMHAARVMRGCRSATMLAGSTRLKRP